MKRLLLLLILLSGFANAQDFSNKTLVYPFYPRTNGDILNTATAEQICVKGYTKTVRHVTLSMRHKVFKIYGLRKGHYRGYEVDHIISLELGGSNSMNNLFPQPYEVYISVNHVNMRMGAREKDVVENNLHKKVCEGKMTLQEAQQIVLTDWVTYYLKLKKKI